MGAREKRNEWETAFFEFIDRPPLPSEMEYRFSAEKIGSNGEK
jgi:hypothetical protein